MKVHAYAAHAADKDLGPHDIERRAPRADDVTIKILYCGVCHSDLHAARNDWGHTTYPIVPGHEIIGIVEAIGPDVTKFHVGEHVGVGCMVDSCRHCDACRTGLEQYCEEGSTLTYGSPDRHDGTTTYGGYSERILVSQDFVLHIPDGIDLKGAAPLLCAGITTWSPLRHWNVKKGDKVAVIGLGGLGHMALKLANAMGAEVTLLTRSPDKKEDALRLGAHRVVISTDAEQMKKLQREFDIIIDTVPVKHDIRPYLSTLALSGTLVIVGYLGSDNTEGISSAALIFGRRAVAGSVIGGIAETQEMLDFCGKHGITSDVEIIRMDQINEAYERMLKSDVKYRFVIDMATL